MLFQSATVNGRPHLYFSGVTVRKIKAYQYPPIEFFVVKQPPEHVIECGWSCSVVCFLLNIVSGVNSSTHGALAAGFTGCFALEALQSTKM